MKRIVLALVLLCVIALSSCAPKKDNGVLTDDNNARDWGANGQQDQTDTSENPDNESNNSSDDSYGDTAIERDDKVRLPMDEFD